MPHYRHHSKVLTSLSTQGTFFQAAAFHLCRPYIVSGVIITMSGLPSLDKEEAKPKAKTSKTNKPSKQKRKLAAALAKLELPTQASEDLAFLYRKTTVAQALAEALEEFGEKQELPEHVVAETMEAFDKV